MDDDPVLLEVDGGVAVVTLNRPERHNAADDFTDGLLFRYLDVLRSDPTVRAVVWRAEGESFSIGRDVAELLGEPEPGPGGTNGGGPNGTAAAGGGDGAASAVGTALLRRALAPNPFEQLERSQWLARLLADFPVPIVCALKGWTLGTAFERALLCDIRLAGESAKMALSAIDHGLLPDSAGVAKLFEVGGASLALELALTGRHLTAAEALRLGLVSQVVPDDELDAAALALARSIAERPPLAVRLVREHVQALAAAGVRGTLGRELVSQAMVVGSHDLREMREARAQDRPPRYERR